MKTLKTVKVARSSLGNGPYTLSPDTVGANGQGIDNTKPIARSHEEVARDSKVNLKAGLTCQKSMNEWPYYSEGDFYDY